MFQQISIVSQQFTVLVDDPRLTDGESNVGVPSQSVDEGLQQRGVRVIVRFGEPEIFTFRLAEAEFPLFEGTTTVLLVEDRLHSLVLAVRLNDFAAVVRGSIVEDDEFDVLESLGQNAIDAFWQVLCVIIVRRDDRDSRHVAGPRWCQAARAEPRRRRFEAQIQGQIGDRTCVSKDAAMPRVGIESGVGHVIIPRQVTPQEDDSRSLDRISQVGRPAVDADEERSSADDLGCERNGACLRLDADWLSPVRSRWMHR